jgi:hypothetical protein
MLRAPKLTAHHTWLLPGAVAAVDLLQMPVRLLVAALEAYCLAR